MAIRTSESVAKIGAALLAVQKQIETVTKGADNPFFKSKYADLVSVMGAVKEPLNSNGITVLQFPDEAPEGHLGLTTRLQHSSGEWMESTSYTPLAKADPQAFGSAITYTRRYALQSILGLLAEDDDAEKSMGRGNGTSSAPQKKAGGGGRLFPGQK
jgi:hypothetical protein